MYNISYADAFAIGLAKEFGGMPLAPPGRG
jgi:hypothetical protein